jgi:hypothetical protein
MTALKDFLARHEMTTGEATIPRHMVNGNSQATSTGYIRLTYFVARKSEAVTQVRTISGGTAAVGATLAKLGVFSVAADGTLTCVAVTANLSASLWIAQNTIYTSSWTASWNKVRGQRYAYGPLFVGTSTAPTTYGFALAGPSSELGQSPRISGLVSGQTDMPAVGGTIAAASVADSLFSHYAVMLP